MSTHYLKKSDIKDRLIKDLICHADESIEPYLDDADNEMIELAYRRDVTDSDNFNTNDDGTIVSNSCKMYLLYWMYMRICEDKAGANQNDIAPDDKYWVKAQYYMARAGWYEKRITKQEITGNRTDRTHTVATAYALRG